MQAQAFSCARRDAALTLAAGRKNVADVSILGLARVRQCYTVDLLGYCAVNDQVQRKRFSEICLDESILRRRVCNKRSRVRQDADADAREELSVLEGLRFRRE